jgi:arylsulfatase A-like enzyme
MKNSVLPLTSAAWQGATIGALNAVGLLLPLDFFYQLHSLLMTVRPLQLIPLYSWGWIVYLILGGLAGGLLAVAIASVLVLLRRDSHKIIGILALWVTSSILVEVLVREVKAYLHIVFLNNSAVNLALIFGLSSWIAVSQRAMITRLMEFLKAVALSGGIAAGITFLVTAAHAIGTSAHANTSLTSSPARPPVILITIDTLAANHMSLYGYSRKTTPSLDELGKQSVVFESHHSNANLTTPSIGSILYGARPWVHRALQLTASPLPGIGQFGLLSAFQHAGYETLTVATSAWAGPAHQGSADWVTRQSNGANVDVNWLLCDFPHLAPLLNLPTISWLLEVSEPLIQSIDVENRGFDPELAFSQARRLLSERQGSKAPSFLWIHLLPPHSPYAAPVPFLGTFDRDPRAQKLYNSTPPFGFLAGRSDFPGVFLNRYDEAVLYVDHGIGQFLDWLREQGHFDDALIIVVADHGESFSHGYGGHGGAMLYEDLTHVPLLIKLPGQRTGRRVAAETEHADLLPTMLDYLGQPVPPYVEGRSLRAALKGWSLEPRPIYSMDFEQNAVSSPLKTGSVAMLDGRYKYVAFFGKVKEPLMPKLDDALYDLQADPGETNNLIAEDPSRAEQMRAAIETQVAAHSLPIAVK